MTNGTIRVRRDAVGLDDWDETLVWYAHAVTTMQARSLDEPTSWDYQAAVHGRDPFGQKPGKWDQCQHQSWYFLPWHRGYLLWFEQIARKAITEAGGPADWALPYWNYSDPNNPDAFTLPPAFRAQQLPNGDDNPLLVADRNPGVNDGEVIGPPQDVEVSALDEPNFQADPFGGSGGFGGPATGFNHGGGRFGVLEGTPHGAVHVDIGGLMGDPATAGLDPIFWLHHANIDRLWAIWIDRGNSNPNASNWLNLKFKLHDADSNEVTFTANDMLDTTAPLLGYRYDNLTDPRELGGGGGLPPRMERVTVNEQEPEMIGATETPIQLGAEPTATSLHIEQPPEQAATGPEELREPQVFLNLENITGNQPTTNYDVYLNVPTEASAETRARHQVGVLSTFGVERASSPEDTHGGGGLHLSFDITELAQQLRESGDWQPDQLQVTFQPRHPNPELPTIQVGRISLYTK